MPCRALPGQHMCTQGCGCCLPTQRDCQDQKPCALFEPGLFLHCFSSRWVCLWGVGLQGRCWFLWAPGHTVLLLAWADVGSCMHATIWLSAHAAELSARFGLMCLCGPGVVSNCSCVLPPTGGISRQQQTLRLLCRVLGSFELWWHCWAGGVRPGRCEARSTQASCIPSTHCRQGLRCWQDKQDLGFGSILQLL